DERTKGRRISRATLHRVLDFARPHRRTIVAYLGLATAAAVIGVGLPVLAGRAVDAIVDGAERSWVVTLAALFAGLSVIDAAVGLIERRTSARLGEGLILDLRRRVFEHVQQMPVAFFTRTHTGAL